MSNTYVGISGFAAMNKSFPAKRFLRQYPKDIERPFLPVLYGYFGKNWKTITQFIRKFGDRPHLIQFHLSFRDFDPNYYDYAMAILWKIEQIQTPHTEIVICPCLEDDISNKQYRNMYNDLIFDPGWPVVRSPWKQNATAKFMGDIQEKHGIRPRFTKPAHKTIANPDGVSLDVGDGEKYANKFEGMSIKQGKRYLRRHTRKNRFAVCLWSATQQGLGNVTNWSNGGLPPAKQRFQGMTAKEIVTPEAIEVFNELLKKY